MTSGGRPATGSSLFRPKQISLLPAKPQKRKNLSALATRHVKQQRAGAEAILQNVKKYGGEAAAVVIWARGFLRRLRNEKAGQA